MNRRIVLAQVALAVTLAACAATPPSSPIASYATASSPTPSPAPVSPVASTAATPSASGSPEAPTAAPTPAPTASPTPAPTPVPPFRLTSAAFAAGGSIPRAYTCDGAGVSPALAWSGVSAGTKALVLVVDDPDAGGFAHWLVLDIRPDVARLAKGAGTAVSAQQQGTNDFGRIGWGGPCPPSGEHRYRFTLYALAAPLGLSGTPGAARVRSALAGAHVLGKATLLGRYRRDG